MIGWLSENPLMLAFANCCVAPLVSAAIGYLVAVYRPRLQSPVVLSQRDDDDLADKF